MTSRELGQVNIGSGLSQHSCFCGANVSASVSLPHHVQELYNFLVDDEDDGHVHTHPAQPGNGTLVEPGWCKRTGLFSMWTTPKPKRKLNISPVSLVNNLPVQMFALVQQISVNQPHYISSEYIRCWSFVLHYLHCTVHRAFILVSLKALSDKTHKHSEVSCAAKVLVLRR